MKLSVAKSELMGRLSNIQNIVEKRNTMPILGHFLLSAAKSGTVITATDIETAIREPLDAAVEKEGTLCVPARKLFEIVREVDGDITLTLTDSLWLKVQSGMSTFKLACLAPDEFPTWPEMSNTVEVGMPARTLGDMIEKTLFSAGESDTRYTLNGLLFHFNQEGLTVVGTDGHRMALVKTALTSPLKEEKKVIVPRKTTAELKKFLDTDSDLSMGIASNHIKFKVAGIEFLARLIEGSYPNYSQVIPSDNDKIVTASRDSFMKALRRVSVMSRERSNAVKIEIEKDTIRLTSSNPDLGEARDEFGVKYSGDELSAGFNAKYILDVLSAMSTDNIAFELKDQLSPTLLKEEGNDSYKCVVMPMRI